MNKCRIIAATIAVLMIAPLFISVPRAYSSTTSISLVQNPRVVSSVGPTFNVTLAVTNVSKLWSWKVRVTWDPLVLNLTRNPIEGSFLKSVGSTWFVVAPRSAGEIPEMSSTILSSKSANGTGALAYLTFRVLNPSIYRTTMINITYSELNDPAVPHNPIVHTTSNTPVIITIPGDVDGNSVVNILDVVQITGLYGKKRGDSGFKMNSDLNNDGAITILDVVGCTGHYGQHYP
jgi:hypothetical protein